MQLKEISDQYKENTKPLKIRIVELRDQLEGTKSHELRRKLKRRIIVLENLIYESYQTATYLKNYYDD